MIPIAALLGAAAVVAIVAPRMLVAGCWQPRFPRLALALWHAMLAVVIGCVAAAAAWATWQAATADAAEIGIWSTVVGWSALVVVAAGVVVITAAAETVFGREPEAARALATVAHDVETLPGGIQLAVYDLDEPFACAIVGRPATIVITRGARELLTPARLRAVIEHEREHLRSRHDLAVTLARLYVACLPASRTAAAMLRTTRLAVELMADDAAARRAGAVHLANALTIIGEATGDVGMIVRAERLAAVRHRPASRMRAAGARARMPLT